MKLEITKFADTKFPNVYTYQKNSLANCHAKGLYSVVLKKFEDGKLLRMFYASEEHDLWKNNYKEVGPRTQSLGLAIHSHHCDIQILGVYGKMINIRCVVDKKSKVYKKQQKLKAYKYTSSILNGKKNAKFVEVGQENIKIKTVENINRGTAIHMNTDELHTVYVEKGQEAAWFILEGKEDENYDSLCYSDDDLTKFEFENYYKPVDLITVAEILHKTNIGYDGYSHNHENFDHQYLVCSRTYSSDVMTFVAFKFNKKDSLEAVRHRLDGPAVVDKYYYKGGIIRPKNKYFILGQEHTEQNFWKQPQVIENKLDKILEID